MSLLNGLLLLGVIGLFLALPGGRVSIARAGWVVLAAAAGVFVALLTWLAGGEEPLAWFSAFAVVGLFAAVRVITHRKPVYSALYFVLLILAVTGMLLLMQAEFLAMALVIVYGGAILVTYVFVIMLAQRSRPASYDGKSHDPFWGCVTGFALLGIVTGRLLVAPENVELQSVALPEGYDSVVGVGTSLFTEYAIGIQLVGLLLLAAMVGAIAIARRRAVNEADVEVQD